MMTGAPKTGRRFDRQDKQEPEHIALFLIMSQLLPGALVTTASSVTVFLARMMSGHEFNLL